MQPDKLSFFATTPKGLELLLVEELRTLGAKNVAEKLAGVVFSGDLETAYRACLWSRLANRILLNLHSFTATTAEDLYSGVQSINWSDHLDVDSTLAVHCVCSQSIISHSLFAAQKVKDAIVDQFRQEYGERPNVDKIHPDVAIYVYIKRNEATLSIDLSGDSLHRRGYRLAAGEAPLKENLAAAILLRAGWKKIAEGGGTLVDPMCGSGTLLIEGALMAGDCAPGLFRTYFGFLGWKQHDAGLWQSLVIEAEKRRKIGLKTLPIIEGYDRDPEMITIALANIERAGLTGHVHVEKHELSEFKPSIKFVPGLVIANPPYGERLGELTELDSLYELFGCRLKENFVGWHAAIFTGNPELGKAMGMRAYKFYALFNGDIPCKLLLFDVQPEYFHRHPRQI